MCLPATTIDFVFCKEKQKLSKFAELFLLRSHMFPSKYICYFFSVFASIGQQIGCMFFVSFSIIALF
jgi:hypothetical protein